MGISAGVSAVFSILGGVASAFFGGAASAATGATGFVTSISSAVVSAGGAIA